MMLRRLTISIFVFAGMFTNAQNLHFEHYGESDGLSQNSIRDIVQDDKGFLWIGTFLGLNRFDGYDFKTFKSQPNNPEFLQDDDIVDLELDGKNNLWVATNFGLTKYHIPTATFKTYHKVAGENNLPGDEIRSVYIDKNERLWVGTKHNSLCYFNYEKETFHPVKIDGVENIRAVVQSQDGKYWFSTFNDGIYSFSLSENDQIDNIEKYKLTAQEEKVIPEIYFLFEDDKFDLFAGTKNGMFKLDKIKNEFELLPQRNGQDYFRCITKGPNDSYWIGTLEGLIECTYIEDISNGNYKRHTPINNDSNSLCNNYILSLFFDLSGVLWIGTENGLDKYDFYENRFKTISTNFISDSSFPIVSSFGKTNDGKLIIGTHSNGLYLRTNGHFERILPQYNRIASIYTVDNKMFYIGLWNGKVVRYNYPAKKQELLDVGFGNSPIFSFCLLNEKTLLIGSNGEGLVAFDVNAKKSKFIDHGVLRDKEINKMVLSKKGWVWIGTENGIFRLKSDTNELDEYSSDNGNLSNDKVKDILIDDSYKVWAATRQGLNYFDPENNSFKVQQEGVDLSKIWITDMAIDSLGVMWLNMNYNQLGKYDTKKRDFRLYYVNNGVRSNIVNKRGFLFYDNSRIYLGGDREVIYFAPSEIKHNKTVPLPMISEFRIQNKEVTTTTLINGKKVMDEDLNYSKQINLEYKNRNFSLKFSTPSYIKEDKNEFQYKLEGFDQDWNTVNSNSRTTQYTNLFPGDYTLKLKASNSNGYWSDSVSYAINIEPPFWLTYKALILFLSVIGLIVYLVRRQIKNRLVLKNALLMEKVQRERDEKLNNEKLEFFTNISHELRTPLTLILGPVRQLLEKEDRPEYEKSRIELINQNASRLFQLVNQILDFRRAHTGELKLKVAQTPIVECTKLIFSSFKQLANEKHISYHFNSELDEIEGWIDVDKYNKILYNILSNALKFTQEYGHVDLFIGVSEDGKKVNVEISDDGIGIPKTSQIKVFNRFYQAKNGKENTTGTGIGLSLVKSLVKLHKGDIHLESELDKGTVVTVEIPFQKDSYNKEEIFEIPKNPIKEKNSKVAKVKQNTTVKQRVLLVDDNVEVRKFLADYFSDFYKIYEADNGLEGLQVCRKVKPDLCVVDVRMPIMDGFAFAEEVKSDENISNTAIIMLTALSENENKIKGFAIGVDGYLVKPFDPSLLKARIENILKIRFDLKQRFSGDVDSDVTALAHSQIDVELISRLTKLIEENISQPDLTSTFLREQLAMSSSKLYRKIKQLTDLSPNEFIRTIRLKKSASLLKTRNYNVSEVSTMVGFNDPLYFSRVFKKQFGYAPSKLLK